MIKSLFPARSVAEFSARDEAANQTSGSEFWRKYGLSGLIVVALLALYAPTAHEVVQGWMRDEYSAHGLFIPFLVGLLVWWKRQELKEAERLPSAWGFLPLGLGLGLEVLGWQQRMAIFATLSIVPVLLGLTLLLGGKRFFRLLCFPICFLTFATPLPRWIVQPVSLPIQTLSANASFAFVRELGIPAAPQGFSVALPNMTVEVAEACSGFKKTASLAVFAGFYAALFAIPLWRQWLLVGLSIPIALCANVVRVSGLILAGAWKGPKGVHLFHDVSELIVMGLCFVLLLGAGRILGCRKVRYMES